MMKKICLPFAIFFGALLIFSSCGSEKNKSELTEKKDSLKQNPFHLPDSVPARTGNIKVESPDSTFKDFAFIAFNDYIIISSAVDTAWAEGDPQELQTSGNGVYAAITNVKTNSLPSFYSNLLRQSFFVYGGGGEKYTAKITGFKLVSAFIPHFGQVQKWNGSEGDSAYTPKQKARDIWNSAALYLCATFETQENTEGEFLFAGVGNRSVAAFYTPVQDSVLETKIISSAIKTEEYKETQKAFSETFPSKKSKWWDDEESEADVDLFRSEKGDLFATLSVVSGNPCGGEFFSEKFSVWTIGKNKIPKLLFFKPEHLKVLLLTDIDNDGNPEFLVEDYFGKRILLKQNGEEWEETYSWDLPFLDCGC